MSVTTSIRCDADGCEAMTSEAVAYSRISDALRNSGWTLGTMHGDRDFCPEHNPFEEDPS